MKTQFDGAKDEFWNEAAWIDENHKTKMNVPTRTATIGTHVEDTVACGQGETQTVSEVME